MGAIFPGVRDGHGHSLPDIERRRSAELTGARPGATCIAPLTRGARRSRMAPPLPRSAIRAATVANELSGVTARIPASGVVAPAHRAIKAMKSGDRNPFDKSEIRLAAD